MNLAGETEIFGQRISSTGAEIGANDFRISENGPNGDPTYFVGERVGLAYSGAILNSYLPVWFGADNRSEMLAAETEVFCQPVEPVLELTTSIETAVTGIDAGDTVRYQIQLKHKSILEGADTVYISLADAYGIQLNDPLGTHLTQTNLLSARNQRWDDQPGCQLGVQHRWQRQFDHDRGGELAAVL